MKMTNAEWSDWLDALWEAMWQHEADQDAWDFFDCWHCCVYHRDNPVMCRF